MVALINGWFLLAKVKKERTNTCRSLESYKVITCDFQRCLFFQQVFYTLLVEQATREIGKASCIPVMAMDTTYYLPYDDVEKAKVVGAA